MGWQVSVAADRGWGMRVSAYLGLCLEALPGKGENIHFALREIDTFFGLRHCDFDRFLGLWDWKLYFLVDVGSLNAEVVWR